MQGIFLTVASDPCMGLDHIQEYRNHESTTTFESNRIVQYLSAVYSALACFSIFRMDKPLKEEVQEDEPEHGCCCRVVLAPLSIVTCVPAGIFLVIELLTAPVQFAALICCKLTICKFCCPDSIHHTFRNIICSPCRWMRISCTGVGHVVCWKHPAWPFRKK